MFHPKVRTEYDKNVGNYLFGEDDCPLCQELEKNELILWKGRNWFILHNLYPYSWDRDHLMAVTCIHKKFSYQLTPDETQELQEVYGFMKNYYGDKDYFSCTRETMAHRSIEHFHMHFIPGKLQGKWLRKMLEWQGFPIQEDLKIE